ncbi:MAG TPA: DUF2637 domain-containing protein [Actinoplanes sp.]|nr:DUF2637 domain-containing protein [Actinoplanes sp.]
MSTRAHRSGRGWAYLGAILGGAVSIAANVAHSYVPPAGAPSGWSPEGGAVVASVFWPVALFVAVEILARTPWPTGRPWQVLRFGGLLPVAAVAAFVSYKHLAGLLTHYGEDPLTATLGPLAVDGLMVMATGALLATGHRHATPATQPAEPTTTETSAPPTAEPAIPATTPAPVRPTAVVPVPASAFTRLNGATAEVTR